MAQDILEPHQPRLGGVLDVLQRILGFCSGLVVSSFVPLRIIHISNTFKKLFLRKSLTPILINDLLMSAILQHETKKS